MLLGPIQGHVVFVEFKQQDRSSSLSGQSTTFWRYSGRVPGSKAVYEKVIDNSGTTISYTKTTYTPEGKIVHIKDKIDGSEIIPE